MDLSHHHSKLFASLMALIRRSNSLYSLDVDFIRSVNKDLASRSEELSRRLLGLINELIETSAGSGGSAHRRFADSEDILKRWRSIEHTFDLLADKVDSPPNKTSTSTRSGSPSASSDSRSQSPSPADPPNEPKEYMRLANNIPKPQLHFANKVDNSRRPFKPLLTQKPFALFTSLGQAVKPQPADDEHPDEWYEQPYRKEIAEAPFPAYAPETESELPDWDSTPFTLVDTPKKLFKMVAKLENATEVAVDVEHHDFRSYLGLVCLVQISGSGEDYVVDALALRSELQILNKVFANPNIVKVFHGAKMDIMWLQRDLGLYVVGLFDTYFAARELGFPKLSLAYLLQRFAGFHAEKKYQLADWRMRPLPQELVDYARADTHFLLYVYHALRRELAERHLTETVIGESRNVAAYRYEHPGWNEAQPAWIDFAIRYRLNGPLQRAILVKLMEWRDEVARAHDESLRYVMAPQFVANLCIAKPANAQGVLAASRHVSPMVRKNASKLAEMIQFVCAHPETVDTTMPDIKDKSEAAKPRSPSQAHHAKKTVPELKLKESPFMGSTHPVVTSSQNTPRICLQVFEPDEMKRVNDFKELESSSQAQAAAQQLAEKEKAEAQKRQVLEQQKRELEIREQEKLTRSKSSGKQLNIVGDSDEFELSTGVKPNGTRKPNADQAAFDFENAKRIMNSDKTSGQASFSRFGSTVSGPKGVRKSNSKFKKAKSFRN